MLSAMPNREPNVCTASVLPTILGGEALWLGSVLALAGRAPPADDVAATTGGSWAGGESCLSCGNNTCRHKHTSGPSRLQGCPQLQSCLLPFQAALYISTCRRMHGLRGNRLRPLPMKRPTHAESAVIFMACSIPEDSWRHCSQMTGC